MEMAEKIYGERRQITELEQVCLGASRYSSDLC